MTAAMTIAGSDPSGGAGIQADLKTFAAFGVYGTSVITAVTAQNTLGIVESAPMPADLVVAQIETLASDISVGAVKIGMLGTAAIVEAVAAAIQALDLPLVVVDPVLVSKGGTRLLDDEGIGMLCSELLGHARVVTPNLPEAEVLSGIRIQSADDVRRAARRICDRGVPAVVVTGGHGEGASIVDLLFDGERFTELRTPRIDTRHTHGSGCTFASAIAANLALGRELAEATARAQEYVSGAIRHGLAVGRGHGPLDHFWSGILKG